MRRRQPLPARRHAPAPRASAMRMKLPATARRCGAVRLRYASAPALPGGGRPLEKVRAVRVCARRRYALRQRIAGGIAPASSHMRAVRKAGPASASRATAAWPVLQGCRQVAACRIRIWFAASARVAAACALSIMVDKKVRAARTVYSIIISYAQATYARVQISNALRRENIALHISPSDYIIIICATHIYIISRMR